LAVIELTSESAVWNVKTSVIASVITNSATQQTLIDFLAKLTGNHELTANSRG
jgi:hypothetical protein